MYNIYLTFTGKDPECKYLKGKGLFQQPELCEIQFRNPFTPFLLLFIAKNAAVIMKFVAETIAPSGLR